MTTTTEFVRLCHQLASRQGGGLIAGDAAGQAGEPQPECSDAESLIGFFQHFRPSGAPLAGLFDSLPAISLPTAAQLSERLQSVFDHAGDDRRPQGGRDAFFIVRSPESLSVEQAENHCTRWIEGLVKIAQSVGEPELAEKLSPVPKIRVLEGIPPKHPKQAHERSSLLATLLDRCPQLTARIRKVDPHAELLRPAYYFIACDAMLRDYLMWPFYAAQTALADPLSGYFSLWAHGVKFRVFREDQIDLYLPREASA